MAKPTFGYWNLRGMGEPIRMMLEYCDVDYEDKRYNFGKAPDCDRSDWLNAKFTLDLDFPNLPYYIDGDIKICENIAILRYLARKHNLMPSKEADVIKCEVAEGVVTELRLHFGMMCYLPDFETNKKNFFDNIFPAKMKLLEKYLENKEWLAGDSLSYVDFFFSETLDHILLMDPKVLEMYKNVCNYHGRFFNLEKIASYRQSPRFQKLPLYLPIAHWGGQEK